MTINPLPAEFCAVTSKSNGSDEFAPPFSIRLTHNQRNKLAADAKGKPLGVHVRSLIFEDDGSLRPRNFRRVNDAEALGKALALLGRTRLSSNLNQLAKAANSGALPVTVEVTQELLDACENISEIRTLLIKATGLRGRRSEFSDSAGGKP